MSFHSWLQILRSALSPIQVQRHHGRRVSIRAAAHRPSFEVLEDRCQLSFSPAASFPVGANRQGVATGDFNNDGRLDLAVANHDDRTVGVLLGDGLGGFGAARQSATGTVSPVSLAVADFNNDGRLDLAVITQDPIGNIWNSTMSTLMGNGDGTFQAPMPRAAAIGMAAGDFNADGSIDLVVGADDFDSGGYVQVLAGNGAGGFSVARAESSPIGFSATAGMAVGDLNHDGKPDTVITSGPGSNIVVPFLGSGDGTFPLNNDEPEYVTGPDPRAVSIGDFTGDGIPDLITVGQSVDLLRGHGDGWFDDLISQTANGNAHTGVEAADFNGDGNLDAVTSDWDTDTVSLLLGNGDGTLNYVAAFATGSSPSGVVVGDFNGDGRPDVAVANAGSNNISVRINDGIWGNVPPAPPTLSINDATVTEGNTGTINATFSLTLSRAAGVDVTVRFDTVNITAIAVSDYNAASGTVTIPAGQTSQTFVITVKGDRLGEATETFAVSLSAATNATIGDDQGIGTIIDNEPRIVISDVSRLEGKKNQSTLFTFTVTLSAAYDQPVTMSYRTANGTATTANNDYVAKSGTLTFAPGETTKTISIEVKGDGKKEANESFYLDLFGNSGNSWFTKNRGLGTILNDD